MPAELLDRCLGLVNEAIARRGQYHDHKEKMAWTAVAFYCPAVVASAYSVAQHFSSWACLMIPALFLLSWGAFIFVHMQFQCRWLAAEEEKALYRACNKIVLLSDTELKGIWDANVPCTPGNKGVWPACVQQELNQPPDQERSFRAFLAQPWWCPFKWHKIDARMRTECASYIILTTASLIAFLLLLHGCFCPSSTTISPNHEPPAIGPVKDTTSDNEILAAMKEACNEFNCSPASLILAARDALRWSRTAVIPNSGPHPTLIDEAEISQGILAAWPEWVQDMVPAGSRWERLHWPDGSITVRLVNPRARVLAAQHFLPGEEGIRRDPR